MLMASNSGALKGSIGSDYPIDMTVFDDGGNLPDLIVIKVGGNFQHQRHPSLVGFIELQALPMQALQQIAKRLLLLQITQVFGVGRGNIDADIVSKGVNSR